MLKFGRENNLVRAKIRSSKLLEAEIKDRKTMKTINRPDFNSGFRRIAENDPAQRDSEMSNLGMGLIGLTGPIGLMGRKPVMENGHAQRDSKNSNLAGAVKTSPAQRNSKNSNLKTRPTGQPAIRLVPQSGDPSRPLDFKNRSAQLDSEMSNLIHSRIKIISLFLRFLKIGVLTKEMKSLIIFL